LTIPNEALDDRLAFVGTSGSGKTYAAGTAVERLLANKSKVVIVDPLDVWWGLRVSADGVRPAFPVIIFGGAHGDLPLSEHAGGLLGEAVADMAESCIVSLGGLTTKAAERRFMLAFLERLYRRATGEPFHLVFDEADLWAPQKASEPLLQSLMEQIVRRGRVKGFIPWLISQRPAVLSKDVLSQADGLIAMKLTSSQDRDALGAWIEGQADKADEKRMLAKLPTMQKGHGLVWIPGRSILAETAFPKKSTFDSSSTPKRGEVKRIATLRPIDLGTLKDKIASIEASQNKPRVSNSASSVAVPDAKALRAAADQARAEGREEGRRIGLTEGYKQAQAEAQRALAALRPNEPTLAALPPKKVTPATHALTPRSRTHPAEALAKADGERLPPGEYACLVAAAERPNGVRREQLTVLTGYKRSSRDAYIARLRARGFLDLHGSRIVATQAGVDALGSNYEPLPVGDALRDRVLRDLPEGERRVLEVLISQYPGAVSRDDIDQTTGYKRSSRDAYLARLRARELVAVTGDGGVKATDDLFSEAA